MVRRLDYGLLGADLLRFLALVGTATGPEVRARLGISQPVFSRLVRARQPDLVMAGRARSTRYAARRDIPLVGQRIPLFEVEARGESRQLAWLHATRPRGFYVEALHADLDAGFHADLPWFLHDLRPAGFLGRLIPRRHPELGFPADVRDWTGDDCLRYLTRLGWNPIGSLLLGEEALRLCQRHAQEPPDRVEATERARVYPRLADDVLQAGAPGSSAGGEQPKFLVSRVPGPVPVLVKFSPPLDEPVGRRLADLLVAEHLAHEVLSAHGQPAARSELLEADGRLFLEVERFDRLGARGRRGVLSLAAFDLEYVGRHRSWLDSAGLLVELGLLPPALLERIRFAACFGRLTADSDMHQGNLSFLVRGTRVLDLAPAYDRAPMLYAPEAGHRMARELRPDPPAPAEAGVWPEASRAALELWERTAAHPLTSLEFREIARRNADLMGALCR